MKPMPHALPGLLATGDADQKLYETVFGKYPPSIVGFTPKRTKLFSSRKVGMRQSLRPHIPTALTSWTNFSVSQRPVLAQLPKLW